MVRWGRLLKGFSLFVLLFFVDAPIKDSLLHSLKRGFKLGFESVGEDILYFLVMLVLLIDSEGIFIWLVLLVIIHLRRFLIHSSSHRLSPSWEFVLLDLKWSDSILKRHGVFLIHIFFLLLGC
jgi:hypothetical protein